MIDESSADARAHPRGSDASELRIVDGIVPFFTGVTGGETNWSKAPSNRIERQGRISPDRRDAIAAAWERYCREMAAIGYNAIAVDDMAHLVSHHWYLEPLRLLLADWQHLYTSLFATARRFGLRVFAVSDYCFLNDATDPHLRESGTSPLEFLAESVDRALREYWLDGVVLRLGESDGVDVEGAFASRLTVGRPSEARQVNTRLLTIFERSGATMVVRTWTLGAFPIGDLV
jgi:hypothetical protein